MPSPSSEPPGRSDPLLAIFQAAGVAPSAQIRVAGPGALPALIWLCRRGFEHAAYVRAGAAAPRERGDVLLLLHVASLAELETLLAEIRPPAEGGVLIVQTPLLSSRSGDPVHAVIEQAGYEVDRCIGRRWREVHVARRVAAGALKRAA